MKLQFLYSGQFSPTRSNRTKKKGKNIKQNWPRQENNFDICLYVSFDCYCQKLIPGAETGH